MYTVELHHHDVDILVFSQVDPIHFAFLQVEHFGYSLEIPNMFFSFYFFICLLCTFMLQSQALFDSQPVKRLPD